MVIKRFKHALGRIEFDLKFNYRITILAGLSGSGKTYLFNRMRDYMLSENDSNIKCFNAVDMFNISIEDAIKSCKNKLIIIDNGDLIVTGELRKYIASDKNNQYLIFGRNTAGMGLPPLAIGKLAIKDKKGYIEYPKIFL